MVLMPPGSAKSTYASVIFPVWWFTQHPRSSIITASHSASLAKHFSRRVRSLILEKKNYLGFSVTREERSADRWTTTTGGEYLAIGVRGAIAGRRADLVIIDDPIASQADAESPRQRNHVWDWFKSDLTTRLKPGGKIVLDHDTMAPGRFGWPIACPRQIGMAGRPSARSGRTGRPARPSRRSAALAGMGGLQRPDPEAADDGRTSVGRLVSANSASRSRAAIFSRPHFGHSAA